MTFFNTSLFKQVSSVLALVLLTGCAALNHFSSDEDDSNRANWSAAKFYTEAKTELDDDNYPSAIELYESLESRYPFGQYAQQAQIDLAYAYYHNDEPESALATANRFLRIHPRHESVEYIYYLKGLINFNRDIGFLERYIPTDKSQRDPGAAVESLEDFSALLRRFPNSKYAADSKQRIIALRSNLALLELNVAEYYMKREAYIAAINRCKFILEQFQNTTAVPRALLLMMNAYQKAGMQGLASNTQRIYDANYPNGLPPLINPKYAKARTTAEKVWDYLEFDK